MPVVAVEQKYPRQVPCDLSGIRFGSLVARRRDAGQADWQCECNCGHTIEVWSHFLREGRVRSCEGCGVPAVPCSRQQYPSEWQSWAALRQRCYRPKSRQYAEYGARGVGVYPGWQVSFANFFADLGPRPKGCVLDRFPDPTGSYEPSNCRWATPAEQARNKRSNRWLTVGGRRLTVADWAAEAGVKAGAVYRRLAAGWTAEEALELAQRSRRKS